MKKLTETYYALLQEAILDEARMDFNQLNENIILVANLYEDWKANIKIKSISEHILLDTSMLLKEGNTIEDFENAVLGIIDVQQVPNRNYNEIIMIAAEKGYGLLLYELAMQMSYPKGIVSSRDGKTKDGAFRLYQYYHDGLNPNVKVEKLKPKDVGYLSCVNSKGSNLGCEKDNFTPKNPELMEYYNSILYMKPKEYQILVKRGDKFMSENKKLLDDLFNAGDNYFNKKYK